VPNLCTKVQKFGTQLPSETARTVFVRTKTLSETRCPRLVRTQCAPVLPVKNAIRNITWDLFFETELRCGSCFTD